MIITIAKQINNTWIDLFNFGDEKYIIYPASLSKIFIAAEVLRQVECKNFSLFEKCIINKNNYIYADNNNLEINKEYSLDTLLFTMLNHSNDTSSNVLIDLINRENINKNTILKYNFNNCLIYRKFLSRDRELNEYKNSDINKCSPFEIKKLFQLIHDKNLHSDFVSTKLMDYMNKNINDSKINFLNLNNKDIIYKGGFHESILQNNRYCRWKHHCFLYHKNDETYYVGIFNIYKSFNDEINIINDFLNNLLQKYLN